MRELIDCHIHTARSGHGSGTVEEYVHAALERGVTRMIFTEHLPLPDELDPQRHLSMRPDEVEGYLADVAAARDRYGDRVTILTGIEADWLGHRAINDVVDALEELEFADIDEYIRRDDGLQVTLGSVHILDGWTFDDPHSLEEWDRRDVDEVWLRYFEEWGEAVRLMPFDVMAHPDLPKKFGHRPSFDPRELYEAAAEAAADAGVLIEVSTAGLRKPVGELYPGPELLKAFARAGVGATVGSDAHAPHEVGYEVATAYEALRAAGYRTVSFPLGRGNVEEVPL